MYDNKLKRLRQARSEFELALNAFAGAEIEVRVLAAEFQRNNPRGPWRVVTRVTLDAEDISFEGEF
jgi:hypothetical protein